MEHEDRITSALFVGLGLIAVAVLIALFYFD